jgi:cytochrome P450
MDRFLQELALAKARGSVNILDLARAMSIDGITEYLFDLRYGAFDDVQPLKTSDFKMSASAVVDNFVSASRFWYLPVSLFGWAEWIDLFIHPNPSINTSTQALDEYADRVMCRALQQASDSAEKSDFASFPVRLLRAGFSLCEVRAQCKDIIFAATDTIGMGLTTMCFMLAKHPQVYEKLRWEIANAGITRDEEVQQITYLTCVIREGLRLSMTNPCRIPREVPAPGWTHEGITYPAGSVVSCSAFEMHFSDNIYASAHSFQPDRWLNPTVDMNQCMMAFGLGNRSCIAKGISLWELHHIVYQIVKADLLRGARPERDRIEILEGFTAKVTQSRVGIVWD